MLKRLRRRLGDKWYDLNMFLYRRGKLLKLVLTAWVACIHLVLFSLALGFTALWGLGIGLQVQETLDVVLRWWGWTLCGLLGWCVMMGFLCTVVGIIWYFDEGLDNARRFIKRKWRGFRFDMEYNTEIREARQRQENMEAERLLVKRKDSPQWEL